MEWSDIGGQKLVGEGTYLFANGIVTLSHKYVDRQYLGKHIDEQFHVLGGSRHIGTNAVTDYIVILANDASLKLIEKRECCFDYMWLGEKYPDWGAIKKEQIATKSTQQAGARDSVSAAHDP